MSAKNLFIIFGTTSGIGKALFEHALKFSENNFILFNRDFFGVQSENIISNFKLDLSEPFGDAKLKEIQNLFLKQKGYKNIYLILNASIVEPIGLIGSVADDMLPVAGFVNFINYERIVNIFVSATKNSKTKKKILAISSGAAVSPNKGLSSYCSTKAALEMFIRCLFLEQQEKKEYSVIAFRPGVVDTNMQKKLRSSGDNFPEAGKYKKIFEEKKLLSVKEVAEKIYRVLLSDDYWTTPVIDIVDIK